VPSPRAAGRRTRTEAAARHLAPLQHCRLAAPSCPLRPTPCCAACAQGGPALPLLRSLRPVVRFQRASYGASFSHPAHAVASNSLHLSLACHVQLVGVRQSGTERVPLLLSTSSGAGYLSVLGTCCCSVLRLSRVYGEGSHSHYTSSSTLSAACMLPLSGAR